MLLLISRDPTPCKAETALTMVNLEVGLDYWLPGDPHVARAAILDGAEL